jgi:hypothetical protein
MMSILTVGFRRGLEAFLSETALCASDRPKGPDARSTEEETSERCNDVRVSHRYLELLGLLVDGVYQDKERTMSLLPTVRHKWQWRPLELIRDCRLEYHHLD